MTSSQPFENGSKDFPGNMHKGLTQIIRGMAVPAFVINMDHVVIHWNHACEKLTGIPATEMLGTKNTWKAYYADKRPVLADLIVDEASEDRVSAYYGGKYAASKLVEGAYEAQDFFPLMGEEGKWLFFTATPLKDSSGTLIGAVETFQDFTPQKAVEAALRERERFLNTLIDAIPIPIFYKDKDGRFLRVNQAFEVFSGETWEQLSGKTVLDVLPADRARMYDAKDTILLEHGGVQEYETQIPDHQDELRHVILNKSVFTDEQGRINGLIGAILDITERKQAEEKRRQLEIQLRQAQKMEAIGTLAGGIAHDFNNILMPLLLNAEMALEDLPPESPLRSNLHKVLKAGHRAKDLVKQILTFSRQTEEQKLPIHILPIVKETVKLLRSILPTTIDIRPQTDAPHIRDTVNADPTQIHQVLMNLCTNALHAMRHEGGVLSVVLTNAHVGRDSETALPYLSPGTYLKMTIGDTGEGMTAEVRERIFEPYFSTKREGEGTGLGLSVVHGIVKDHKGTITVDSEPGNGTQFHLFFPLVDPKRMTEKAATVVPPGGSERILFVDDEQPTVQTVREVLGRLGYRVESKTSSMEALAAFKADPKRFDLVITDQTMPGMTGVNLAEELMNVRSDIPVILCTGFSEQINEAQAKDKGIRAFIMKPVAVRQLAETIRTVLDNIR